MILLFLFAAVSIVNIVFLLTTLLCAICLRTPVEEINVFIGPSLYSKKFGTAVFNLRLIPLFGNVRFDREASDNLGFIAIAILVLGTAGAQFFLSVLLLGVVDAFEMTISGTRQYFAPIDPAQSARDLSSRVVEYVKANAFTVLIGAVAAKSAAVNILPLPGLNGWQVIVTVLRSIRSFSERVELYFSLAGFFLVLAITFCWIYQIVICAWNNP